MSKRKQSAPQKRKQESDDIVNIPNLIANVRKNYPESRYPRFQMFAEELNIYYKYDSLENIDEFGERVKIGSKSRKWFGDFICKWILFHKSDIDSYKNEIVEMINFGCRLNQIGLAVKESLIPNAGYGLFATKDYAEDEYITEYGGFYCSVNIYETYNKPRESDYVFQFPEQLGNAEFGPGIRNCETTFKLGYQMGRWINSDKDKQNLRPDFDISGNSPPKLIFLARKNIKAGEELYWWYGEHYTFLKNCIICNDQSSEFMCEVCELPICGLSCHDEHIDEKHN